MILSEKKLRSIISQIIRENIEENSGFAPDSASASGANSALSLLLKKSFTLLKQICEEPRTNPGSLNQKELMYPVIEELIGFDYSGNKIHKMLRKVAKIMDFSFIQENCCFCFEDRNLIDARVRK